MNGHQDSTAERIVADALDAIIYAGHDGTIRLWNHGAERMFGWSAQEAQGKSLDIIIPEKHRPAHWRGWDRVMASGETRYGSDPLSVPGVRKDGSTLSLDFTIIMLKDAGGEVEGVAAILRDVSQRWQETRELRRRVRELTQTRDADTR
ncbi:PAS domain S-box protein [Corynebacterium suedekumii]|nr:PAS domain S-box protein [Corynebacterium suedekumii]